LKHLQKKESIAFEVAGHYKRVDDDDGSTTTDLRVVEPGEDLLRPSFVTRFVSWEHEVGHHDPLTDIYVLGLVLASVAIDKNLADTEHLAEFVRHRKRLATLNTRLHPVVARAIVDMTELERHKRVQDLRAIIATLKNYREQTIASRVEEKAE